MKKRIIAYMLSIILVFSYSANSLADENIDATEELSIDEITEEEQSEKLNNENDEAVYGVTSDSFSGGYIDTGTRLSPYRELSSGLRQSDSIPTEYDSRTEECITSVKDQSIYGTCWAFAAVGAGEAALVKRDYYTKDEIDLSELQLAYYVFNVFDDPMGNISEDHVFIYNGDNFLDFGGNDYFSLFTLSAWKGAVDESDVPYTNAHYYMTLDDSYAVDKDKVHLQNTYIVPMENADLVKKLIMNYGAVSSGIYYPEENVGSYFVCFPQIDPEEWSFYQDVTDEANHAVIIIGWDDNYSIENFSPEHRPVNPGAWLVKNSWGDDKSYIWISYEDLCLSNEDAFAYLFENADNYDYNYQYDGGVTDYWVRYKDAINGFSNVFDVYGDDIQSLDAVAVAVAEDNIDYELQIYRNPSEGAPLSGIPLLDSPQTGHLTYAGYNTIILNNPQRLYPGDSFSVVLKLHNSEGKNARVFIDKRESVAGAILISHVEEGQSFLLYEDGSCKDFATYYSTDRCARIKAYTTKDTISDSENNIADCTISAVNSTTYTGEKAVPEVTLSCEGATLINDVDYVLSCDNIDVGTATVNIYGKGSYTGKVSKTFTIKPADIGSASYECAESYDYTGNPIEAVFSLTYNNKTLTNNVDYTYTYKNNTNVGIATVEITGKGNFTGTRSISFIIKSVDNKDNKDNTDNKDNRDNKDNKTVNSIETIDMYRLYNPNSGEHFYTAGVGERDSLVSLGWKYEGVGWKAPKTSDTPVYRLYNPNAGDHHYTMSSGERDYLITVGCNYEGIGWYSDDSETVPIYRQYNPNANSGSHNYTVNKSENDWLVGLGWQDEGIGWYGIK